MHLPIILVAICGLLVSIATALPTNLQPKNYTPGQWNDIPHSNVTNYNTTTTADDNHHHTHGPIIPVLPHAVHKPTDLATRNVLWTMTLCDQPDHAGICVNQPMQNNYCIPTPITSEGISVYLPDQTACQVYNNDDCHIGAEGELSLFIAKDYSDLRGMQRAQDIDFPWLSWVCHNSIGE